MRWGKGKIPGACLAALARTSYLRWDPDIGTGQFILLIVVDSGITKSEFVARMLGPTARTPPWLLQISAVPPLDRDPMAPLESMSSSGPSLVEECHD